MTEPAYQPHVQGIRPPVVLPVTVRSGRRAGGWDVPLVSRNPVSYAVKRGLDYLVASVGLMLALPLIVTVAVLVKVNSSGPVFFLQERVGRGGRRFRLIKFRTMYDGVSDDVHREFVRRQLKEEVVPVNRDGRQPIGDGGKEAPMYKLVFDPRVTRVGRVLRRASLDELPQLLNVLRGEMSVVGPRPPLPYELDDYEAWQFERLSVIPGLTGLWQVSGRNLLSYRQMCELDVEYVRTWSLWVDFKILVKTVPVVLFRTGWTA